MKKEQVAKLTVAGGLLIFAIKLIAYLISGSVALLSDALESIVNIVASVMMLVCVNIAMMPADADHKYGHQRAENISCLVEGILIIIAALLIILASVGRLFHPVPFTSIDLALVVSLTATALNGGLSYILSRSSRENGSIALEGDAKHLLSDVISSIGIVIGLFLAKITGWYILDPILALIVAALLVRMAISVLKKTTSDLMDHSLPEIEVIIEDVLKKQQGFLQYHDLKTRHVGDCVYAEMHICVHADSTVAEAHDLTERIEEALREKVPSIVVSIHMETERQIEG
ncbi:MAG: cation diffusion facilitator family transporter [Methanomassiliicoccales archaeon]|nr:cation diffusion facilitator family transporter [Methanomassiliicoccales archaeon]